MELWQIVDGHFKSKGGRPRKFNSPGDLWEAAVGYFEWCTEHPLVEDKVMVVDKSAQHQNVFKMRAMTLTGLQLHIGVTPQCFLDYEAREEFFEVVNAIRGVVRTQKFEGAAAGMLNPNIIARDLGLADKQEIKASIISHEDSLDLLRDDE